MIERIERLLTKWFNTTPKQTYTKLLEQFDGPEATMGNLPTMLVEFWKRVHPGDFINGPSVRDMMYIPIELRHNSVGDLEQLLTFATGALVQDDEATIMDIAKEQFAIKRKMTLDDYFAGARGGSLSYFAGVTQLKAVILYHGTNIEHLTSTYHSRVLNRMYNDILYVTKVIIENMPEE